MSKTTGFELLEKLARKEPLSFDDFIQVFIQYGELSFSYKNKKYGVMRSAIYELYQWNVEEGYQSYKTIEEFEANANIDGEKLKDIWKDIKNLDFA